MPKLLKYGHAPGHVRDAACAAFEAWAVWDGTGPEPTVEYEVHYGPHQILLSRACKLVWNCTDIVPGSVIDQLLDEGLGARAIVEDIKLRAARARRVAAALDDLGPHCWSLRRIMCQRL